MTDDASSACPQCGNELEPESTFCADCGATAPAGRTLLGATTVVIPEAPGHEPPTRKAERLGSGYRMFERLGEGGMGVVRRGLDSSGTPVAIKLLHPEFSSDPAIVSRFLQERSILTGLTDEHLVRIRDLVAEGSRLAIVMDLVDGPDLRRLLVASGGTFPAGQAVDLVVGVLGGLAAVHDGGVVHRDIKPENVLLEGGVVPKLTDFGISSVAGAARLTRLTSIVGTPEYMAPELGADGEPSVASDVYAVGILLYELLCGTTPFRGGNPLAVLRKHADNMPGRPDGIADSLWTVVAAALAKDPAARPATASAMADQLTAIRPELTAVAALPALEQPPLADVTVPTVLGTSPLPAPVDDNGSGRAGRTKRLAIVGAAVLLVVLVGAGTAFAALHKSGTKAGLAAAAATSSTPTDTTTSAADSASNTDSASASSTAVSGVMPNVVGESLSDAISSLTTSNIQYKVDEVLNTTQTDGTVLAQNPAAGSAAPTSLAILTVARQPVTTYLSDIGTVSNNNPNTQPQNMNGTSYSHSLSVGLDDYNCSGTSDYEYDLGRHYRQLDMTVGLNDASGASDSVLMETFVDGRRVSAVTVTLGHPMHLNLDVTNGLRVKLQATQNKCVGDGTTDTAVWGNAALLGVPSEVPSPTPTDGESSDDPYATDTTSSGF